MDLKKKIKEALKEVYGEFETHLEIEYEAVITENLLNGSHKDKTEWATYNQVILEFKHKLNNMSKVKELQYKLTDDADPNQVCIEIISESDSQTDELKRLYYKIKNF